MRFTTSKSIIDVDQENAFNVGGVVTIKWNNGGGCQITKITDTGFHFKQGSGSDI